LTTEFIGKVEKKDADGNIIQRSKPGLLQEMLTRTDGYSGGTYMLHTMNQAIMSGDSNMTRAERERNLALTKALGTFDKKFIGQTMIQQNVMDSATNPEVMSLVLNMYRSFPTAFSIQRVFRDSSKMSITGFFAKHAAHLLLDTMYMMLIQVAAGRDIDEILEDFEKRPEMTIAKYLSRWPGLGPWFGAFVQGMLALGDNIFNKTYKRGMAAASPISLSALGSLMDSISKLPNAKNEQEFYSSLAAVSRILPVIGEAATRAIIQTIINSIYGDPLGSQNKNMKRMFIEPTYQRYEEAPSGAGIPAHIREQRARGIYNTGGDK